MFESIIGALFIALGFTAASVPSDSGRHNYRDRDGASQWVRLDCSSSLPEPQEKRTICRNLQDGLVNIGFVEQKEELRLLPLHEGRKEGAACIIDTEQPVSGTGKVSDFYCHGKKPFARVALTQRLQTLFVVPPLETRILENPDAGKEPNSLFPGQTSSKAQEVFIELELTAEEAVPLPPKHTTK